MDVRIRYTPTERQKAAHQATETYKLFGGAMGGGKTIWLVMEILFLMCKYPGNRAVLCRYHLKDLWNSTMVTLFKLWPKEIITDHNKTEHCITLANGSKLIYMGLSEEGSISKFKSMEFGVFGFDESSEIPKEQFDLACTRLRWVLPHRKRPKYFGLLTSNPEDCWLKDLFINKSGGPEYIFIPSLPKDNPHLPADYVNRFKNMPTEWFNRYWQGSWDDLSQGNFVIPQELVNQAVNRDITIENKSCMGIDVARGIGGDETSIYIGRGGYVDDSYHSAFDKTDQTAMRAQRYIHEFDIEATAIDDIGIGAGVTDMLSGYLQMPGIEGVNVGCRADDERFFNLRAQIWWHARQMFEDGKVSIPDDQKLVRQLGSVKYRTRNNGKIMLELKEDTKSRIGMSPDRADALVLMLWASRNLSDKSRDFHRYDEQPKVYDPYGWDGCLQAM